MKIIKVPELKWALGDVEQQTFSGVTISIRPLYCNKNGQMVRIGDIKRDYADPLMRALDKDR